MEDGPSRSDSGSSVFEFTLAEVVKMEKILKEVEGQTLGQEFFQDLALSFSQSKRCSEKSTITWEQVQSWFHSRKTESKTEITSSSAALELFSELSDSSYNESEGSSKSSEYSLFPEQMSCAKPINVTSVSCETESYKKSVSSGKRITDVTELAFEARSAKDSAWYDVAFFLSYRVLGSGELLARVRFSGFNNEEDEWVSVKRAVRERSIPLQPSECDRVRAGDIVLCFQERQAHAVYCDARVIGIQRRIHDLKGCRCIFTVRYNHDKSEEKVQLERLCCRPKEDDPLASLSLQELNDWE